MTRNARFAKALHKFLRQLHPGRGLYGWFEEVIKLDSRYLGRWLRGYPLPSEPNWTHFVTALQDRYGQATDFQDRIRKLSHELELARKRRGAPVKRPIPRLNGEVTSGTLLRLGEQRKVPFLAPPRSLQTLVGRNGVFQDLKRSIFLGGPSALRGIPGVGKTSLALSLAYDKEVVAYFPDGILWCGLGPSGDALAALGRWALAAGVSPQDIARANTLESRSKLVHAVIGMQRMLLVADDVWSAPTALAFRIGGTHCAQIVTTRLLDVAEAFAGNQYFEIEELTQDSSAELLAHFVPELIDMDPAKAASIIEAVGGSPMAIVLVGSYLRSRARGGKKQLLAGIDYVSKSAARLGLSQQQGPAEEYPGLPPRARLSLEAIIGISYQALSPRQQLALRGLAVFPPKPNFFSEDAGLVVARAVPDDLAELVNCSLVEMDDARQCRVHQTIFDYLRARGTQRSAQFRLVTYYTSFVQRQGIGYQEVDVEFQNIQASLEIALATNRGQQYLIQVLKICPYLDSRGLYSTAEKLLKIASTLRSARKKPGTHAEVLFRRGQTLHRQGQLLESESVLTRAAELNPVDNLSLHSMIFDELGYLQEKLGRYDMAETNLQLSVEFAKKSKNQECLAMALSHAGWIALSRGHYDEAKRRLELALEIPAAKLKPEVLSSVLIHLGWALIKLGKFSEAERVLDDGYAAAESINFRERMAAVRLNQGVAAEKMGHYEQAEQLARQALQIAEKIHNREKISAALTNLGLLAEYRSQYEVAERKYSRALEIARDIGHIERISNLLQNLGSVSEYRGHFAKARSFNTEALELTRPIGHQERLCSLLEERGSIEIKLGDLESAQRSLDEGLQIARDLPHPERQCAILRHLAELALVKGDAETAEELIDESSELASQLEHQWQKTSSHMVRGEILLARGRTVEATHSFRCALRISRKIRSQAAIAEALFGLSHCRAKMSLNILAQLEAHASLRLFREIGHYRAKAASDWLTSLEHLHRED
jgi:tetratricopeptide (TPR) repeat protein